MNHDIMFLTQSHRPLELRVDDLDEPDQSGSLHVNIDLLMLAPDSPRNEDLMVFVLQHQRLVRQHNIDTTYALEDLIAKIPDNHQLKGALVFNSVWNWSYEKMLEKITKTLLHAIKTGATTSQQAQLSLTKKSRSYAYSSTGPSGTNSNSTSRSGSGSSSGIGSSGNGNGNYSSNPNANFPDDQFYIDPRGSGSIMLE